jgi:hypothetical protein
MADGIFDGISNALGGAGDFFLNRGRYADPNAINEQFGVPEQDVRQAGINTLANVSSLLLAAGQPMTGTQRAQLLAGIGPALGGMQGDIFKASQARLMNAQMREKTDEMREVQAINQRRREDPAGLARAMGISEDLVKAMDARSLRDVAKQVSIKRATASPLQQAVQARVGQIMAPALPSSVPGAPPPSGVAAPGAAAAAPEMAAAPEGRMTASMARSIASDPIILAGNPELAKQYAEIADKLETPGAKEAQILRARADAQRLENMPKLELTLANRQLQTQTVKDKIDEAIANTGYTSAGLAASTAGVGTSPANTLKNALDTIRSNIGFTELQKMRDESPTGGALGQVAVQELGYLQAALGSLDQSQRPDVLIANLKKIKGILDRYETIRLNAFERDYGRKPDIQRLLREPELVEQKAQAAGAVPPSTEAVSDSTGGRLRVDPDAIAAAKRAIASGAPAAAVRQRLRDRGISDEGL